MAALAFVVLNVMTYTNSTAKIKAEHGKARPNKHRPYFQNKRKIMQSKIVWLDLISNPRYLNLTAKTKGLLNFLIYPSVSKNSACKR